MEHEVENSESFNHILEWEHMIWNAMFQSKSKLWKHRTGVSDSVSDFLAHRNKHINRIQLNPKKNELQENTY